MCPELTPEAVSVGVVLHRRHDCRHARRGSEHVRGAPCLGEFSSNFIYGAKGCVDLSRLGPGSPVM